MKKLLTGLTAVAVFTLVLSVAFAQQQGGQGNREDRSKQFFDRMDGNGDGQLSRDEFRGPDQVFERLDENKDGSLTLEEMKKGRQKGGQGRQGGSQGQNKRGGGNPMMALDTNKDGTISKDEYMAGFAKYDKDGDGKLSMRELMAQSQSGGRSEGQKGGKDGSRLKKMDTDGDGKVSKQEFLDNTANKFFGHLDKDGDGYISKEESEAMKKNRPKRQNRPQDGQGGKGGQGNNEDRAKQMFSKMDANGDGKLSRDEFRGPDQAFDKIDENNDGSLTMEELQKGRKGGQGRQGGKKGGLLERNDTDSDGKVSKAEMQAGFAKHFDRVDKNGDGFLTEDEMPKRGKSRGQDREGRGRGNQNSNFAKRAAKQFNRFDKDGDGMLSQDEAPRHLKDRFTQLDANDDGFLSQDEIKAAAGDAGARRKQGAPKYITDNDADGDGKLSPDEFSGSKSNFKAIDKNGDGFITAQELLNSRK